MKWIYLQLLKKKNLQSIVCYWWRRSLSRSTPAYALEDSR